MKLKAKLLKGISILTLCTLPMHASFAASADAAFIVQHIYKNGNRIIQTINNLYAYIKSIAEKNYFAKQPGIGEVIQLNSYLQNILPVVSDKTAHYSFTFIYNAIGPNLLPVKLPSPSDYLMFVTAGDSYSKDLTGSKRKRNEFIAAQLCGNYNFSFDSLISPNQYVTKELDCDQGSSSRTPRNQRNYAYFYLQYASGMLTPTPYFSLTDLVLNNTLEDEDAEQIQDSDKYKKYKRSIRNILTTQSLGLSNLLYLYNLRLAGKYDKNGKAVEDSAMETAEKIATRRTKSPKWYDDMTKAMPPVLQREMVFILAEMQAELHQMRKENQRLLATISAQQVQSAQIGKALLNQDVNDLNEMVQSISAAREEAKQAEKQNQESQ